MIGILLAILVAAVIYWFCLFIGLPVFIAAIAALIVLLVGVSSDGWNIRR